MDDYEGKPITLWARLEVVLGCAFAGAVLGFLLSVAVYNVTDEQVWLGYLRPILLGAGIGAAFGAAFPRVGQIAAEIVSKITPC